MTALLEVEDLRAGYGPVRALHGVDVTVQEGAVAAILLAGLLLVYFQPLRRFRLIPVLPGPVGFVSLQQRPG